MSEQIDDTYIAEEGMTDLWNVWYSELHNNCSGLTLRVDKVVESTQSEFQRIEVLENRDFGKLLVLYGSLMVCENDNNSYNEMISHVPLFVHPKPDKVLIIGGGDCGTLTETLKHPEVGAATMVEIDRQVVEMSKRHFPALTSGLSDPRANLLFEDGKKFIEQSQDRFDLIMLDLSDPVGPAADLFQKSFHQDVYNRLSDDGIMVAQSESPYFNQRTVKQMYRNLRDIFPIVRMYTCFMPIYPSGFWSFAFCSKKYHPIDDFDIERFLSLDLHTRYYNEQIHCSSFSLPQFIADLLK